MARHQQLAVATLNLPHEASNDSKDFFPFSSPMHFFQKARSSSSLPSSPSSNNSASPRDSCHTPGRSSFSHRQLTRQRKLRHITDEEVLGLRNLSGSAPGSPPDSAPKLRGMSDHWSSCAVPQPLPLPESPLTKKIEPFGSHLAVGSPEETSTSILRRNSADQSIEKVEKCSNNARRSYSHDSNCRDYNLRLSIPARSAPASGLSSPSVSPPRSNGGDFFAFAADSAKCSTNCLRRGLSHDLTYSDHKWIASPRSAPSSGFSSPVVGPQRSNTGDFSNYFVAHREFQGQQPHPSQASLAKNVHSPDYSPLQSPASPSHPVSCKSPNRFSFPSHHKEWPEGSSLVNAHPLPLPPGATPSQSFMPSPPPPAVVHHTSDKSLPAVAHHTNEKSNASMRKGQWQKGKLIGRGTYGSVYIGTNRVTGASCAMKEVDIIPDDPKSAECIKQLEQEIRLLQQMKHQNIVQYYGSEIVDDHFYIYLEYVHPGSISKYIREHCGDMTESIVRNFTRHILSGLAYLHSKKTIHRDIKGANLLVDSSGTVKLADFGMAKHLTGLSYELSLKGSPHWMAPEVIKAVMQKDANPDLAFAVDIWSLGCTIIEMFTGKPPWGELQGPSAMFKALNRTPPIPETLSSDGKDFLSSCLRRNPADRPSAQKLLEHRFVRNSNDLTVRTCIHALSAVNVIDKAQSSGDCTADKTDVTQSLSCRQVSNGKLPSNSESGKPSKFHVFNCATSSSHHTSSSMFEGQSCPSHSQVAHSSHNFSSGPNVPSSTPIISSVNNHPLALLRSHGREISYI